VEHLLSCHLASLQQNSDETKVLVWLIMDIGYREITDLGSVQ